MNPWTEEREAALRTMWTAGASARDIAVAIGGQFTRCSVIGKAHRLHLEKRERPVSSGPRQKPPRQRYVAFHRTHGRNIIWPVAPTPRAAPAAPPDEPASLNIPLLDLTPQHCRWPHGEGPYLFCGHAAEDGSPYCSYHASRALSHERRRDLERLARAV